MGKRIRFMDPDDYLSFLLTPSHKKLERMSQKDIQRFIAANKEWNTTIYSGEGGTEYDSIHEYGKQDYFSYFVTRRLEELFSHSEDEDVLEIGSGSGYFTASISRRVSSLVALEPSEDLCSRLKQRLSESQNTRIVNSFVKEYAPKQQFDTIVLVATLHHIPLREKLFDKLLTMLTDEGRIILIEPAHNVFRKLNLIKKYFVKYRKPQYNSKVEFWGGHDFITRSEIRYYSQACGIKIRSFSSNNNLFLKFLPASIRYAVERFLASIPLLGTLQQEYVYVLEKA